MNQKGLSLVGLLLVSIPLLLIFISVGYVFKQVNKKTPQPQEQKVVETPSPIPTPSATPLPEWQSYENDQFLFTFQHPVDAKVEETQLPDYSYLTISTAEGSVQVAPKGKNTDRLAFGTSMKNTHEQYLATIGGQLVKGEVIVLNTGRMLIDRPFTVNNYDFFVDFNNADPSTHKKIEKILSSFTFVNKEAIECNQAKIKSVCEKIDNLRIERGKVIIGKDGKPDCKWDATVETMYFCSLKN